MALLRMRFINSTGLVAEGIDFVTNSLFSHCEIITDKGYLGAHLDGGIQLLPFDYCKPSREMRYAKPCTDDQLAMMEAYGEKMIGTKYDLPDIAGLALHARLLHSPKEYICSRFLVDYAESGGLYPSNALPAYDYLLTPELVHASSFFRGCSYTF